MSRHYTALAFLSRLQSELNRLFKEFEALEATTRGDRDWSPSVDIFESESELVILAEMPGVHAEDVKLEMQGGEVVLSGTKRTSVPRRLGVRFHRVERAQGTFRRRFRLNQPVNGSQARAELVGGLLRIALPKIEDQRQRRLPITINESDEERQPAAAIDASAPGSPRESRDDDR